VLTLLGVVIFCRSIVHLERRRAFRLYFVPSANSSSRDISVAELFLDLGDVGVVIQLIAGGGCAKRVGAISTSCKHTARGVNFGENQGWAEG
jgi:hypothetical protein